MLWETEYALTKLNPNIIGYYCKLRFLSLLNLFRLHCTLIAVILLHQIFYAEIITIYLPYLHFRWRNSENTFLRRSSILIHCTEKNHSLTDSLSNLTSHEQHQN